MDSRDGQSWREAPFTQTTWKAALPIIVIAAAALAAILPTFWWGNPSGHDFEFHMNSWMEVARQWHQGIFYPRWAAQSNFGYGEPRFIFYPPASWMLGATLSKILPWKMVPGAYIWIVLTAAGCSMFALARRWLPRRDAIFAAALYAVNPYHLVIIYWRSAFAELMASIWLPLLLLCVLRLEKDARKAMLGLTLVIAAAWLTNAPAAVLLNYSLVILVGTLAWLRRSPRLLMYGAIACVLGGLLAGFYLFPAAYERRWVSIDSALAHGLSPKENFLFSHIDDVEHNRFNRLVSIIATVEMVAFIAATWLAWRRRRDLPEFWPALAMWGGAAVVLMLPFTNLVWRFAPELRFAQFPWRWLLFLGVALALFVTMGMRNWWARAVVCVVMLAGVVGVWRRVQAPWWDTAADIAEMSDDMNEGAGYEGVDEYVPNGGDGDPTVTSRITPEVTTAGNPSSDPIEVSDWSVERRAFNVDAQHSTKAIIRLFNYPAWRVEVNGRAVTPEAQPETGQMLIPLEPGKNRITISLARTADRTEGAALSAVTLILIAVAAAVWKRKTTRVEVSAQRA